MRTLWHAGRHAPMAARLWWWPWALLVAAFLPLFASASCLPDADPDILRLQQLVSKDAHKAVRQAQIMLDSLQREAQSGPDNALRTASRIAALYGVQAEAYGVLELDANARATAREGSCPACRDERDPVHLELLMAYTAAVYDSAGIAAAIQTIEAARASLPAGSRADTCLLINRGLLEHRLGREDLAIVTLPQAYRASADDPSLIETHIMAADTLSLVMRSMGDYSQALALNQEKIDWDSEHGSTMALSVSRFMRGQILNVMGNYDAAIAEFEKARSFSASLGDQQGIAFVDQRDLRGAHRARTTRGGAARMLQRAAYFQELRLGRFAERDARSCRRASTSVSAIPTLRSPP